jgi:hypothetical protein
LVSPSNVLFKCQLIDLVAVKVDTAQTYSSRIRPHASTCLLRSAYLTTYPAHVSRDADSDIISVKPLGFGLTSMAYVHGRKSPFKPELCSDWKLWGPPANPMDYHRCHDKAQQRHSIWILIMDLSSYSTSKASRSNLLLVLRTWRSTRSSCVDYMVYNNIMMTVTVA